MIVGLVTDDGVPLISLEIHGRIWDAIVDTGFNGDLELPEEMQGSLNDQPVGRLRSALAGGQMIEEDAYTVDFPFDGRRYQAIATFAPESQILIGTHLLREHSLLIQFTDQTLRLERDT